MTQSEFSSSPSFLFSSTSGPLLCRLSNSLSYKRLIAGYFVRLADFNSQSALKLIFDASPICESVLWKPAELTGSPRLVTLIGYGLQQAKCVFVFQKSSAEYFSCAFGLTVTKVGNVYNHLSKYVYTQNFI